MLSQLAIKNLAIVSQLDLAFTSAMTVVTGETGAGKSILLQALNLALGARADADLVRHNEERAEVSAAFEVSQNSGVQNYLKTQSLADDGECILRRIISSDGHSKAFVNGVNVPLSVLRNVGELLVDIHGQNQHQLLLRPQQQREFLDQYADIQQQCAALNQTVAAHIEISQQIDALNAKQDLQQQQKSLLSHQLDELTQAALVQNELNTIEADFKTSANAADLLEKTADILNQLDTDTGVNTQLLHLGHQLSQAAATDVKLSPSAQLLMSAQVQVQEVIYALTHYLDDLSNQEQNAQTLEARLSELHDLARKHQGQIIDLLKIKKHIENQLKEIDCGKLSQQKLCQQQAKLAASYQTQAQFLSAARAKAAKAFSAAVTKIMQVLGMPGSVLRIDLSKKPSGVFYFGAETVEFLVTTNAAQDFKPLKKIASGGELSRISLAISVISSSSEYTPTLIFDEVDVGISGAVAQVVGSKLQQLSKNYQVICITHLAQVAAFGHQHLRVHKKQNIDGAQITVVPLLAQDRVDEVARILSGASITEKTRSAAQEMIKLAFP